VRTLVDIPDDDIDKLDALAARGGRSRAAEIREAVKAHLLRKSSQDWIARGAGYWQGREALAGDGVPEA